MTLWTQSHITPWDEIQGLFQVPWSVSSHLTKSRKWQNISYTSHIFMFSFYKRVVSQLFHRFRLTYYCLATYTAKLRVILMCALQKYVAERTKKFKSRHDEMKWSKKPISVRLISWDEMRISWDGGFISSYCATLKRQAASLQHQLKFSLRLFLSVSTLNF